MKLTQAGGLPQGNVTWYTKSMEVNERLNIIIAALNTATEHMLKADPTAARESNTLTNALKRTGAAAIRLALADDAPDAPTPGAFYQVRTGDTAQVLEEQADAKDHAATGQVFTDRLRPAAEGKVNPWACRECGGWPEHRSGCKRAG